MTRDACGLAIKHQHEHSGSFRMLQRWFSKEEQLGLKCGVRASQGNRCGNSDSVRVEDDFELSHKEISFEASTDRYYMQAQVYLAATRSADSDTKQGGRVGRAVESFRTSHG